VPIDGYISTIFCVFEHPVWLAAQVEFPQVFRGYGPGGFGYLNPIPTAALNPQFLYGGTHTTQDRNGS